MHAPEAMNDGGDPTGLRSGEGLVNAWHGNPAGRGDWFVWFVTQEERDHTGINGIFPMTYSSFSRPSAYPKVAGGTLPGRSDLKKKPEEK